jgi:PhnB protein
MTIENGRPDGYTTLTPFLVCSPAAEAIDFYCAVFGARVVSRMDAPDGTVAHAELDLGLGRLQLGDPSDAYELVAPPAGPASSSTSIYVADVDGVTAAAVARGATLREPPASFVTGDRFASLIDPFGHRWAVLTRVEDLTQAQIDQRLAEWATAGGV